MGADTVTLGLTNGKRGNNASSTPWVGISPDNNDKVTFIVDFEKATIRKSDSVHCIMQQVEYCR